MLFLFFFFFFWGRRGVRKEEIDWTARITLAEKKIKSSAATTEIKTAIINTSYIQKSSRRSTTNNYFQKKKKFIHHVFEITLSDLKEMRKKKGYQKVVYAYVS